MHTKPNLSQAMIIDMLSRAYGLRVKCLTFVPKGEVSYGYIVDCVDCAPEGRYFLKLLDTRARLSRIAIAKQDT